MKSIILLPKIDKRFKHGNIKKDKNGTFRGNYKTASLIPMDVSATNNLQLNINPPLIVSPELAKYIEERLI